jgi:hypothetical protein
MCGCQVDTGPIGEVSFPPGCNLRWGACMSPAGSSAASTGEIHPSCYHLTVNDELLVARATRSGLAGNRLCNMSDLRNGVRGRARA